MEQSAQLSIIGGAPDKTSGMWIANKIPLIIVLLAAVGPLAPRGTSAEPAPLKRVLVLLPFEASRPGSVVFLKGIEHGLRDFYSGSVDVVTENVGPVPPEPENYPARIGDWIALKYGRMKFDAIIGVSFPPALLAKELRDRFWPDATLLLVLINEERWANPGAIPRSARVVLALDNKETVLSALQMLPDTRRVVVLGGASQRDKRTNGEIVKSIRALKPDLELIEIAGLTLE